MKRMLTFALLALSACSNSTAQADEIREFVIDPQQEYFDELPAIDQRAFEPVTEATLVKSYKRWVNNQTYAFGLKGVDLKKVVCSRSKDKVWTANITAIVLLNRDTTKFAADISLATEYNDNVTKPGHHNNVELNLYSPGIDGGFYVGIDLRPDLYEWFMRYNPCLSAVKKNANSIMTIYKAINLFYD